MAYINTDAILNRVRELCESAADSLRQIPVGRFEPSFWNVEESGKSRRALINPRYDIRISSGPSPHKSTPPVQSGIAIYDMEIEVLVSRQFNLIHKLLDADRDSIMGLAAMDADVLQQVFSIQDNLRTSVTTGEDTGIASGVMRFISAEPGTIKLDESKGNMIIETVLKFSTVVVLDISPFDPADIPDMVFWQDGALGVTLVDAVPTYTTSAFVGGSANLTVSNPGNITLPSGSLGNPSRVTLASAAAALARCGCNYTNYSYNTDTTVSLFVQSLTAQWFFMCFSEDGSRSVSFDVLNGVIGTTRGSGITGTIEAVNNGWYRCEVTGSNAYSDGGYTSFIVGMSDADSLSPAGSTGQQLYVYPDSITQSNVSAWADQDATAPLVDFSAASGATQPQALSGVSGQGNGRQGIRWGGQIGQGFSHLPLSDFRFLHDGTGATLVVHMYIQDSVAITDPQTGPYTAFGLPVTSQLNSTNNVGIIISRERSPLGQWQVAVGNGTTRTFFTSAGSDSAYATRALLVFRHDSSSSPMVSLRINGSTVASGNYGYAPSAADPAGQLCILHDVPTSNRRGIGTVFSQMAFSRYLSDTEVTQLEGYLSNRYG